MSEVPQQSKLTKRGTPDQRPKWQGARGSTSERDEVSTLMSLFPTKPDPLLGGSNQK